MTVLALRMASASNGVSKLHGEVSRGMWKAIWPGVPEDEIPIGHVTNGVHFRSWISHEMNQLYDRYLGPKWREEHADANLWRRVESIPAEELWRTHERRRERLVAFARRRLRMQLQRRGAPQSEIDAADEVLDPDALTIGFARRFATYKRAALLLRDVRPAGADSQPAGPAGADRLRRQGASARRCRQGADPADREARAAEGVPPPPGLPGRLRHGRGPIPGAGLGRLAQYAAAAAGGQRHQRHEGAGQRRLESQHAGRLVGRGLARRRGGEALHRLGHRERRELRQSRISGPGGSRRRSTICWSGTSSPASTSAAPTACRAAGSPR